MTTLCLPRDWTLVRVQEDAKAVWRLYRRESQDDGEVIAFKHRTEALRDIITRATRTEGKLPLEEVTEVLKSVAAQTLSRTSHA
ncbi:MAG: hypothetical protein Q8P13_01590 [bacterium]|nr:hypothetical protein [bacterium]